MSGDIRTCRALICYALSVALVSGLISDRQAIEDFLKDYNREAEILTYNALEARWTLYTNNSEDANNILALANRKLSNFSESMSLLASQFNLSSMSKLEERQFNKIIAKGTRAKTNDKESARLSSVNYALSAIYDKEVFPDGSELYERLQKSKSHDLVEAMWLTKADVYGRGIKDLFTEYVKLRNEALRTIGYADLGAYRRSWYDTPTIEDDARNFYDQLRPLWEHLHAYIRRKLMVIYGRNKFPSSGHIPAHLFDLLLNLNFLKNFMPFPGKPTLDITDELLKQNYTAEKMFKIIDDFYISMGMKAATPEFWNRSLFYRVPGAPPTQCNYDSWNFHNGKDYRVKICVLINSQYLNFAHHEMGHIQYFMQFADQPVVFQDSANPEKRNVGWTVTENCKHYSTVDQMGQTGRLYNRMRPDMITIGVANGKKNGGAFYEAVGDAIVLAFNTQEHLHRLGLLAKVQNDTESELNMLMSTALNKVMDFPFNYKNDLWRWRVFRGDITPDQYNKEYWNVTCFYQGLSEPVQGSRDILYAALTYDIKGDSPGIRYFVGDVVKHQLHKAICNASGHQGPLHKCDLYNNKKAGEKLSEVLKLGSSKPWPEVLQILTGQPKMDAAPMLEYYQPLMDYLKTVNQNDHGWDPVCPKPKPKLCKASIPGHCTCDKDSECEPYGCCKNGICIWG